MTYTTEFLDWWQTDEAKMCGTTDMDLAFGIWNVGRRDAQQVSRGSRERKAMSDFEKVWQKKFGHVEPTSKDVVVVAVKFVGLTMWNAALAHERQRVVEELKVVHEKAESVIKTCMNNGEHCAAGWVGDVRIEVAALIKRLEEESQ